MPFQPYAIPGCIGIGSASSDPYTLDRGMVLPPILNTYQENSEYRFSIPHIPACESLVSLARLAVY